MRPSKWYRSEKPAMVPFLHRIWHGCTPMRGGKHQCQCAQRRLWEMRRKDWKSWRKMFEPVREVRKVWRARRAVPYWSNKP